MSFSVKVYGLKVSYFTGKLEAYLRYKEIPYEFVAMTVKQFKRTVKSHTGAMQMPAVELSDGRWMTDTTPMIEWFEQECPEHPIIPTDPLTQFAAYLIEDYADEWLWRPAMYYRWNYPESATLLSEQISSAMGADVPLPKWLKRSATRRRQYNNFVRRDGVSHATREHVEQTYIRLLKRLAPIVSSRGFLLGERPTLADIGLMGPMLRHFSMDPIPASIMREDYPEVMSWVYRVWSARGSRAPGPLNHAITLDLNPLLTEIAETHLPALVANARAFDAGQKQHSFTVQGVDYCDIPTSQYRVWCLQRMQQHLMETQDANALRQRLKGLGIIETLESIDVIQSGYNEHGSIPFSGALPVFESVKG
jgi:glutathione S-transferase